LNCAERQRTAAGTPSVIAIWRKRAPRIPKLWMNAWPHGEETLPRATRRSSPNASSGTGWISTAPGAWWGESGGQTRFRPARRQDGGGGDDRPGERPAPGLIHARDAREIFLPQHALEFKPVE